MVSLCFVMLGFLWEGGGGGGVGGSHPGLLPLYPQISPHKGSIQETGKRLHVDARAWAREPSRRGEKRRRKRGGASGRRRISAQQV